MGHGHGDSRKLEEHLKVIEQKIELLVSHAEATPQITRLLWRMDLNLRQLTGTASNLPPPAQAALPAAPAQQDPGRGSDSHQGSKAHARKSFTITGSRNSSRLHSKQNTLQPGQ